ncbi:MAG: hypothetical protein CBC83_02330 [Flavobacteriales bacterium TMED123]|nr:hypothetical protein [Candidatus Neomarinimicrobiota bacterium]MAJ44519.1 hypothetical protein [Candidatus Neomarinimicrobiota bacterium]OUV73955.1 MAG: hypothetical protein CBC83_04775 [Flavobacteriales bacterium TMED123]OUV75596.1 MAG: hypothetical protein CBC83_02330 [Flavobacteriales bacterium TMED123]|tara:strand:+ start:1202 stop:1417 length:216 start_codon:yes stop_codon:yes gene_type:complete
MYTTLQDLLIIIATALGASILALIRMIFTNEKKIQMLEKEISYRTDLLEEVRQEQKEMRRDIQRLFEGPKD